MTNGETAEYLVEQVMEFFGVEPEDGDIEYLAKQMIGQLIRKVNKEYNLGYADDLPEV